jgi:putative ABC transport system permease protein
VRLKLKEREPLRSVYDIAPLEELTLACVGLYGTLSYVVNLRRREVGLRLALGAVGKKLVGQFLAQALRVVVMAIVTGLVLSFFFTRLFAGMLYGVSPGDPVVLATVVAIVLVVATVAALIPAMRAALVEPMQVLREG